MTKQGETKDICTDLKSLRSEIERRALAGEALGQIELGSLCQLLGQKFEHVELTSFLGENILPSLSAVVDCSSVHFPTSRSELPNYQEREDQVENLTIGEIRRNLSVRIVVSAGQADSDFIDRAGRIAFRTASSILQNSLFFQNLESDSFRTRYRKVRDIISTLHLDYSADFQEKCRILIDTLSVVDSRFDSGSLIRFDYKFRRPIMIFDNIGVARNGIPWSLKLHVQGCIKSGNPSEFEKDGEPFIIFPLGSSKDYNLFFNSALIIRRPNSISLSEIYLIHDLIESFNIHYTVTAKHRTLEELYTHLSSQLPIDPGSYNWNFLRYYIISAFEIVAQAAISFTNSHSFTMRLLSERKSDLAAAVDKFDVYGERLIEKERAVIDKFSISDSCNAFTFQRCTKSQGYTYIPNLPAIPDKYKEQGLLNARYWRHSRSELCIPIYFKKTKIGVVNIESPQEDNYDAHIRFLLECANAIMRSVEDLTARFDARWIGELTRSRAALHEAKQITEVEMQDSENRPLDAKNRGTVAVLHKKLQMALATRTNAGNYNLREFVDEKLTRLDKVFADAAKRITVKLDNMPRHNPTRNPHISFIIEEVIQNHLKSSDGRNTLHISYQSNAGPGNDGQHLLMVARIFDFLGSSELKVFSLQPLEFDGRMHFGSYLSAALARTAGGWVSVEGNPNETTWIQLTIRVPIL